MKKLSATLLLSLLVPLSVQAAWYQKSGAQLLMSDILTQDVNSGGIGEAKFYATPILVGYITRSSGVGRTCTANPNARTDLPIVVDGEDMAAYSFCHKNALVTEIKEKKALAKLRKKLSTQKVVVIDGWKVEAKGFTEGFKAISHK